MKIKSNNNGKGKKVALALSGGVDSAVSALLLKEQGYDVICVHMVCWEESGPGCSSDKNRVDAAKVAGHLNLPILVWDFVKEYKVKVIDYFYSEYKAGRTPNPDVMCNKEIKFGLFFDKAFKELKVDYIATGHYARIVREDGRQNTEGSREVGGRKLENLKKYKLFKGSDPSKDQSYFLYQLNQKHLSKTLFPVGDLLKSEVRKIAKKNNLPVWDKPDSQGICFIGEVNVQKFLEERIKSKEGSVLSVNGKVIGKHKGAWFYTIGQRHGISYLSNPSYFPMGPKPLYVISKDVRKNTITVGLREQALVNTFFVEFGTVPFETVPEGEVRIRHLGELYSVENITSLGKFLQVELSKPAFGVAPGQSAVFYRGEEVLGGGIICINKL